MSTHAKRAQTVQEARRTSPVVHNAADTTIERLGAWLAGRTEDQGGSTGWEVEPHRNGIVVWIEGDDPDDPTAPGYLWDPRTGRARRLGDWHGRWPESQVRRLAARQLGRHSSRKPAPTAN